MFRKFVVCTVLVACLYIPHVNGQIKKGAILLGGNLSFSSVKYDIYVPQDDPKKIITTSIMPSVGKAIADDLIVGIRLNYGYSNSDNIGRNAAQKFTEYGGYLFIRKYKALGGGFNLFGQGDIGFGTQENTYFRDIETENIKRPGGSIGFNPGLSYTLSKKFQLEMAFNRLLEIRYTREKRTVTSIDDRITEDFTANYFGVSTNIESFSTVTIGFRLLIFK